MAFTYPIFSGWQTFVFLQSKPVKNRSNLYSSKVDTNESTGAFFPPLENQKRLSQEEQSLCERTSSSEKTPGSDGLPCEFYKVFWNDLAETLLNALNYSFETGKLSISQ